MSILTNKRAWVLAFSLFLASQSGPVFSQAVEENPGLKAAIQEFSAAIAANPYSADAYLRRGVALRKNKQYDEAIKDYDRAMQLAPDQPGAYNAKAWLLATSADAKYRNPKEALRLAKSAVGMSNDPDYLDTLSAAYAANDRFREAMDSIKKAIEIAEEKGAGPQLEEYRKHKDSYKNNKSLQQ